MSDNPQWEIIQGDALKVLSGFGAWDLRRGDHRPALRIRRAHPGGKEQVHGQEILQHGRPCSAAL